jgi:chromatin segregation and condensation protein Rec8/ScpA/Scc1 (kleisin family)
VDRWKRDIIVEHFVPILHLEQDRKIETEQPEIFKEIYISVNISQETQEKSK